MLYFCYRSLFLCYCLSVRS